MVCTPGIHYDPYLTHCAGTEFYETDWPISVCHSFPQLLSPLSSFIGVNALFLVLAKSRPLSYVKFAGAATMCLVTSRLFFYYLQHISDIIFIVVAECMFFFIKHATLPCLTTCILVVMILRMYGLHLGNRFILYFLLAVLCGQVIVMAYAISTGVREWDTYRLS